MTSEVLSGRGRRLGKPAGTYHHGSLRDALIRATLRVVHDTGPATVTLRGVARRAGVSEAAPYHHFRDKDALLAAAAAVGFDALHDCLRGARDAHPEPRAALIEIGIAWVQFALAEPGAFRLLFGAHVEELARDPDTRTAGHRTKVLVREAVRAYLGPGRSEVAAETLFRALWAQVHGVAWLTLERELGQEFTHDDALALARTSVALILDGYAAGE